VLKAQDLVQETYSLAVKAFDRLTPNSNLKGWLFSLLRGLWFGEPRGDRPAQPSTGADDSEPSRPDADEDRRDPHVIFMRKITREEVRSAIEGLPAQYREVVLLRDLEDFSYQEIAAIVGCPVGTVMSRLGRARDKLRLRLDQWHGGARSKNRTKAKA
ncbi:MAG TPA: sigma-70 family RNA polymerase sigma factor, partial [Blastocatellia bacterium]